MATSNEEINKFITKRLYAEAAKLIIANNAQKSYAIDEIAIPLYLQESYGELHKFLENEPELLLAFAGYLDNSLSANVPMLQLCKNIGMAYVNCQQFVHETIKKQLVHFVNRYRIKISLCPQLLFVRQVSALNFFIYKKYTEHGITEESWAEMVASIIEENPRLPLILVKQLVKKSDHPTALIWATNYNVPQKDWPRALKEYQERNIERMPWRLPEDNLTYLHLPVPLQLVETPRQLSICLDTILESPIIGIDEEWKPSLGIQDEDPSLALIQIATRHRVFIIDIFLIKSELSEAHWKKLMLVFSTPKILKLAFHFDNKDLSQLKKCSPLLNDLDTPVVKILDLKNFYDQLAHFHPEVVKPVETTKSQVGLSKLTLSLLGLPLNKKEQQSNWEKRPLRSSLLSYAALDAFCLIQIFDALHQRALGLNLNFDELVENSIEKKMVVPQSTTKTPNK